MPQYVTLSLGAKVDKGPEIKSEAKFEGGAYGVVIEEIVCKCSESDLLELQIDSPDNIDMLIISSDKYSQEKDACIPNGKSVAPVDCKYVKYWFVAEPAPAADTKGFCKSMPFELSRPHILVDPFLKCIITGRIKGIVVQNDLTTDVKISAIVVRKPRCKCG